MIKVDTDQGHKVWVLPQELLVHHSPPFRSLLDRLNKESNVLPTVPLPDHGFAASVSFVQWMYLGEINTRLLAFHDMANAWILGAALECRPFQNAIMLHIIKLHHEARNTGKVWAAIVFLAYDRTMSGSLLRR